MASLSMAWEAVTMVSWVVIGNAFTRYFLQDHGLASSCYGINRSMGRETVAICSVQKTQLFVVLTDCWICLTTGCMEVIQ